MLPIMLPDFMKNNEWYRYDEKERKYVLTEKAPRKAVNSYNKLYSTFGNRYYMTHSMVKGMLPEYIMTATLFWIVSPWDDKHIIFHPDFFSFPKKQSESAKDIKPKRTLLASVRAAVNNGLYMPCGLAAGELKEYYLDHEVGHIFQAIVFRDEMASRGWTRNDAMKFVDERYTDIHDPRRYKWYYDILNEITARNRMEIIAIAKKANPNFSERENLSKVAMMKDQEFFAEACANSQSSKPNEIGMAMKEWINENGSGVLKVLHEEGLLKPIKSRNKTHSDT